MLLRFAILAGGCAAIAGCYAPRPQRSLTYQIPVACPPSTRWNGEVCVWRYVVTDVTCPTSTVWDGQRCVGATVTCPAGSAWDSQRCVALGEPPAPGDAIASDDTIVTPNTSLYNQDDPEEQTERRPPDAFQYR